MLDPFLERAGELKGMLLDFAMTPRFAHELSQVMSGQPAGEAEADSTIMAMDNFVITHQLANGSTVIEEFVHQHPELTEEDRDLLLSWRDPVDGIFEVTGKDRDTVTLLNLIDEMTYRTFSNRGGQVFRPVKKGMFMLGRLVPLADDWLISGAMDIAPAAGREAMLATAAEMSMRYPEAVFRNPEKLAEARAADAKQQKVFVELFGSDLVVIPGSEVPRKAEAFYRGYHESVSPSLPPESPAPALDLPDYLLAADSVAMYFLDTDSGLNFFPNYRLLEDLFDNPALIRRRLHRDVLSEFLRDPDIHPDLLRRLAARDPAKASTVLTGLLKRKRRFSWEADGEKLLRRSKPSFFDGTRLPSTVPLSKPLSDAYMRLHGLHAAAE